MPWPSRKSARFWKGICFQITVNMRIAIPPKHPLASVIGFLKGKSAIAVVREFGGKERNLTGEHPWARGYPVSKVSIELEQIRQYIRAQEEADGSKGQI